MPNIQMAGPGWTANILHSDEDESGFFSVMAQVDGATHEIAAAATQFILRIYAKGRLASIRTEPEIATETDFDTKITRHRGFVRFSYALKPGEHWHYPNRGLDLRRSYLSMASAS